jgi:hypothetical protein
MYYITQLTFIKKYRSPDPSAAERGGAERKTKRGYHLTGGMISNAKTINNVLHSILQLSINLLFIDIY